MKCEKIKKLIVKNNKMKADLKKQSKVAIKEAFIEFFQTVPEAAEVMWAQWTPSFNDGDACTFGIGEFFLKLKKADLEGLLSRQLSEQEYADHLKEYDGDEWDLLNSKNPAARKVGKKFEKFVKIILNDDLFEAAFGDHVEVRARPGGKFTTQEFNGD